MDWKLLLGGALMAVLGGLIVFRFRKSNYNRELGPGCLMAIGMLMLLKEKTAGKGQYHEVVEQLQSIVDALEGGVEGVRVVHEFGGVVEAAQVHRRVEIVGGGERGLGGGA